MNLRHPAVAVPLFTAALLIGSLFASPPQYAPEPLVIESHAGLKGHTAAPDVVVCVGTKTGRESRWPITPEQINTLNADDPCPTQENR